MNANFTIAAPVGEVMQADIVAGASSDSPSRGHSGVSGGPFRPSRRSLGALRAQLRQGAQPCEIVGGHCQGQKVVDLVQSLHHHLADRADERHMRRGVDLAARLNEAAGWSPQAPRDRRRSSAPLSLGVAAERNQSQAADRPSIGQLGGSLDRTYADGGTGLRSLGFQNLMVRIKSDPD